MEADGEGGGGADSDGGHRGPGSPDENLRRFAEARDLAERAFRAERDRRDYELAAARAEVERLREEREAGRNELAALHDAWEDERRGLREQLGAAHRQAQLERDHARAAGERLRLEGETQARIAAEREARDRSVEGLLATALREADDRLLAFSALRCERDDLRNEVAALRAGRDRPGTDHESLRAERDELVRARSVLRRAVDDAEAALACVRAEAEGLRGEVATLAAELARRDASPPPARIDRLPILARDLERWATPPVPESAAPALPQAPPTAVDLGVAERQVEMLRRLVRTPITAGRPLHAHFDEARYHALQARLREAALLADRLFNQVERSRSSKDLLWHLMVAQRTEEINRNRRR